MVKHKTIVSIVAIIVAFGVTAPVVAQPLVESTVGQSPTVADRSVQEEGNETTTVAETTTVVDQQEGNETTANASDRVNITVQNVTTDRLNVSNLTLTNVTVRTAVLEQFSFKAATRNLTVENVTFERLYVENTTLLQASATNLVIHDREVAVALLGEEAVRSNVTNLTLEGADLRQKSISGLTIDGLIVENASISGAAIEQLRNETQGQAGNMSVQGEAPPANVGDDSFVDLRAGNVSIERIEGVIAPNLNQTNTTTTAEQRERPQV